MEGGVMEYKMSSSPAKKRGLSRADRPYSMTDGIGK